MAESNPASTSVASVDPNEQAGSSAEGKCIADMITRKESELVKEKEKEIEELKALLEKRQAQVADLARKFGNLEKYAVWEQKEMGNLLGNLAGLGSKESGTCGHALQVGPLKDEKEVDEFHGMLTELSVKMKNGVKKENFELLQKMNHLLLDNLVVGPAPANLTVEPTTSTATGSTTDTSEKETN